MAKNKETKIEGIDSMDLGIIIEIKDGYTKAYEKGYKINYNDYIIKWEGYTIVNKDIKDIRPYVRYLATNKKEKLRHNLILYMAVWLWFLVFLVFNMKWDVKEIKNLVSSTGAVIEETDNKIRETPEMLEEKLKEIIEAPKDEGKGSWN